MDSIRKYFPDLTPKQDKQFADLKNLYDNWNEKINLISRKDMDLFYQNHVLHSLAIAKFISFKKGTRILDIGTGGGFPGIPLAILFPECSFVLVDSIAKKVKVAEEISNTIELRNTDFAIGRVENLREKFHFVVARAVAPADQLYRWTQNYVDAEEEFNSKINGYLFLKGGDLREEIKALHRINKKLVVEEVAVSKWFNEPFFETKKLVYVF